MIAVKSSPSGYNLNFKWFDKPFDRLTVLSKVEGLTTLSQSKGKSQITIFNDKNTGIKLNIVESFVFDGMIYKDR